MILIGSGENPDKEKMYKLTEKHKNIHLIELFLMQLNILKHLIYLSFHPLKKDYHTQY